MKKIALLLAAFLAPPASAQSPVTMIVLDTGPCFGACPVYRVIVRSDGSGRFEGRRFTAVTGTRTFRVTPRQYRAFVRHLAPLRPERGQVRYAGERCRSMATDLPSMEVAWRSGRDSQSLYFYFGCDMQRNRAIASRLAAAPGLLPIGDYIRPRR